MAAVIGKNDFKRDGIEKMRRILPDSTIFGCMDGSLRLSGSTALAQETGIAGPTQMGHCDQQTYTITVENSSGDPACNLVVTSTLPSSHFSYVDGTTTTCYPATDDPSTACGTCNDNADPSITGSALRWDIDTLCGETQLETGEKITITYDVATNCDAVSGTNPVQLQYDDCAGSSTFTDTDALSIEVLPGDLTHHQDPCRYFRVGG